MTLDLAKEDIAKIMAICEEAMPLLKAPVDVFELVRTSQPTETPSERCVRLDREVIRMEGSTKLNESVLAVLIELGERHREAIANLTACQARCTALLEELRHARDLQLATENALNATRAALAAERAADHEWWIG